MCEGVPGQTELGDQSEKLGLSLEATKEPRRVMSNLKGRVRYTTFPKDHSDSHPWLDSLGEMKAGRLG